MPQPVRVMEGLVLRDLLKELEVGMCGEAIQGPCGLLRDTLLRVVENR